MISVNQLNVARLYPNYVNIYIHNILQQFMNADQRRLRERDAKKKLPSLKYHNYWGHHERRDHILSLAKIFDTLSEYGSPTSEEGNILHPTEIIVSKTLATANTSQSVSGKNIFTRFEYTEKQKHTHFLLLNFLILLALSSKKRGREMQRFICGELS